MENIDDAGDVTSNSGICGGGVLVGAADGGVIFSVGIIGGGANRVGVCGLRRCADREGDIRPREIENGGESVRDSEEAGGEDRVDRSKRSRLDGER